MENTIQVPVTAESLPVFKLLTTVDIPAGSLLRIRAGCAQMLMIMSVDEVRLEGRPLPCVHRYTWEDMGPNFRWYIQTKSMMVMEIPSAVSAGSEIEVSARLTFAENYGAVNRYSGISWAMAPGIVPDVKATELIPVCDPAIIEFVATAPHIMEAYRKPDGRLLVQHIDVMGNPTASAGIPFAYALAEKPGSAKQAKSEDGVRAKCIQVPDEWKAADRFKVSDEEGRSALTNARPSALDGTPIYFGECHWHTDVSGDGQRPLERALISARDELCLDFAGPADHMSPSGLYAKSSTRKQAEICKEFDQPGQFCTIPGSELSDRYGHTNIYADSFETFIEITDRFEREVLPAWQAEPNRYVLRTLAEICPEGRAIIVPHHSNMDSFIYEGVIREDRRPSWNAMHWRMPAERTCVRNFEMTQTRGCFETEETADEWGVLYGGFGGSARTGLMRGYRYGFVSGTDNHSGWPTRKGTGYCGLTAVQAQQLDTKSVFQAMYKRRCYATSGARMVGDTTLNGFPIGSELALEPGVARDFRIEIHGTTPLVQVQIIHMGYVLADLPVGENALDFTCEWSDERPGRPLEDAWYYVRARQQDGHRIWLSPFWVDLPDNRSG